MDNRKDELIRRRGELEARQQRYHAHQHPRERSPEGSFSGQASEHGNDEVVESLADKTAADIAAVDHALERISLGVGDVCERCGSLIEEERLALMPETTRCAECAR